MKLTAELQPEGTFITLQELRSFVQYVDSLNTFADDSHVHVMPKHVEVVQNTQQRTLAQPEHVEKQQDNTEQQPEASAGGVPGFLKSAQNKRKQRSGNDITVHSTDSSAQLSANDGTAQYGKLRPYAR